jgi:hypothetical protein
LLGAPILEEVHNHHNFAWRETHGGEELWVVRKGATPAFPGQKGFVGGTMGEIFVRKASKMTTRNIPCTAPFMVPDASWAAWKQKAK